MLNNWKELCLSPYNSIRDALELLNKTALKIVLIVKENKLIGIVNDGDIRRALLNNRSLDEELNSIINLNPIVMSDKSSDTEILSLMNIKKIDAIPIVNGNILVGLKTRYDLLNIKKVKENPIFIMAGGFGTRLKPLTNNCPKPLLKIGDKPILEIIIRKFINDGFHNFYISTHYLPHMIHEYFGNGKKWGIEISYVHEETPLGTGGALGLLPMDIPSLPLIMINGDILTNLDFDHLLATHIQSNALATMCVRKYHYQIPYGVVEQSEKRITKMIEKPKYSFNVNAGIYVINPDLFKSVNKNMKIDMPTLLEQEIAKEKLITTYEIKDYWLDIGQISEFNKAQKDIIELGL